MSKPIAVTDSDFQKEVLESDVPVLVDFWADWCQPCKTIAPIVEDLAEEFDGKMKFTKLDVDSNPGIATTYRIRSIPTLLLFRDGQPVDQVVGAVPKAVLKKRIEGTVS